MFTNITIGPYARRGLFFNEYETRNIIRHYVSMVNPRLPLLESPVKHLLVDKVRVVSIVMMMMIMMMILRRRSREPRAGTAPRMWTTGWPGGYQTS